MTINEEAARQMVLMEAGLASMSDIVSWADGAIIASDRPHPVLIDISTAHEEHYYSMYGRLRELAGDISRFEALRYALPALRTAIEGGRLSATHMATFLYTYLCGQHSDIPEDMRYLYAADDEFYLAVAEKYGDEDLVRRKFLEVMRNAERA